MHVSGDWLQMSHVSVIKMVFQVGRAIWHCGLQLKFRQLLTQVWTVRSLPANRRQWGWICIHCRAPMTCIWRSASAPKEGGCWTTSRSWHLHSCQSMWDSRAVGRYHRIFFRTAHLAPVSFLFQNSNLWEWLFEFQSLTVIYDLSRMICSMIDCTGWKIVLKARYSQFAAFFMRIGMNQQITVLLINILIIIKFNLLITLKKPCRARMARCVWILIPKEKQLYKEP
jgi:hypothetical protein